MILCIPVTGDGSTAPGWGRTHRMAVASASSGQIVDWQELDVGWDTLSTARLKRPSVERVTFESSGPGYRSTSWR